MSKPRQRLDALQQQFPAQKPSAPEIWDAYIIPAARTPCGTFNGVFTNTPAPQLGAVAVKEAVARSSIPVANIAQIYMGNVMQVSQGQSPARQASIFAGLPLSVDAITVNKVCASGMKAVVLAAQQIQLGQASTVVAGGMGKHDPRASKLQISRADQDSFAISSYERAQKAWVAGLFKEEVVPVTVKSKNGEKVINEDAGYRRLDVLKPAFPHKGQGSITAASSSPLSDGASALVLCDKTSAKKYGKEKKVLARMCGYADAALDPIDFPLAPAKAIRLALSRAGIEADAVAVWEINEAFAAVVIANKQPDDCLKISNIAAEKINPRGGAIALGHALGNSGSRIIVTLLHQLSVGESRCAAVCNGGGAATANVVQKIEADHL